jgi:transcriptional regulator GlxA family with amidase domain
MQIAIALFPQFTALDAIGPYQVFTNVPGEEVVLVAERRGRLTDENGLLELEVEHTFDDVPTPDLLLVPGGIITRRMVRDGHPIVDWIAAAHPHTTYTTSVCTGALLLGKAGVLDGLPATTHWFSYDDLRDLGAFPTERRVVIEGKVATAAGVSAGIDLALTLVGKLYGPEMAEAVQLGIEYDPQPPFDSGAPSKAAPAIRELVATVLTDAEARVLAEPGA